MNINEIAALAGTSPSTVSRVFSHYPGIRSDIREKVMTICREHGYHPRFSSRQRNVVIITPYNSNIPVQSCVDMILHNLVRLLPEREFRVEIVPLNNLERLDQVQFCGAVAIGVEPSFFAGWSEKFTSPLIIMDRQTPVKMESNVAFVHSDETQGMALAVDHLVRRGHQKIGCIIHGTPERGNALIRKNAIEAALQNAKIEVDPLLIRYSGDGSEKYVELIGAMFRRGITALFCPGGNAGILSLYAIALFGRKIPDEISLIASEQSTFSQFTVPPLTSITPDYTAMAAAVADIIEKWIFGEKFPKKSVLPYSLIERESVLDLTTRK